MLMDFHRKNDQCSTLKYLQYEVSIRIDPPMIGKEQQEQDSPILYQVQLDRQYQAVGHLKSNLALPMDTFSGEMVKVSRIF